MVRYFLYTLFAFYLIAPLWGTHQLSSKMVSLKAPRAYLRVGPGKIYPIRWILTKSQWPLKILDTFDMWYQVVDPLGSCGWIHKSLLQKRPTLFLIKESVLRRRASFKSRPLAIIEKGALVTLRSKTTSKEGVWCYVIVEGFKGYIPESACWQEEHKKR